MRRLKREKSKFDRKIGKREEDPKVSRIIKKLKKKKQKQKILNIILIILICVFFSCIVIICFNQINNIKISKENNLLKNSINENSELDRKTEENTDFQLRINKVKQLKEENADIVGWLEISNTNINYPVLQGKDNDFYMNHNYKKEKTKEGSLFLDKAYDWTKPSENLLIYGHNNRGSKEMFVDLLKYKDENFYKENKIIRFTTPEEDEQYQIISVFLSRVYYKHEKDVFRYYFFVNAEGEKEFNEYVENAKKASLYDIEDTAKYGDQLITLSTCEYSQEDGRFVVVAKKIK